MKKVIVSILTLSIVLLSFSCSPNLKPVNVTDIAKKYGYYMPFPVYWGMSQEECIKALGVNRKDVKFTEKLAEGYTNFEVPFKLYDKEATILFIFLEKEPKTNRNLGLTEIGVTFQETQQLNSLFEILQSSVNNANLSYVKKEENPSFVETNYPFNYTCLINSIHTDSFNKSSSKQNNLLFEDENNENSGEINTLDTIFIYVDIKSNKENPNVDGFYFVGKNAAMLYHKEH